MDVIDESQGLYILKDRFGCSFEFGDNLIDL